MFANMKVFLAVAVVLVAWCVPVSADTVPLFVYDFPAASVHIGDLGTVIDQSSAHHDAQGGWFATNSVTDPPTGQSGNGLDFGTTTSDMRVIFTNEQRLLNTPDVAFHGGFVYDVWFKRAAADAGNGARQKLIDYDGTDALELNNNQVLFAESDHTYNISSGAVTDTNWHHVTAIFDTLGNPAVLDTGTSWSTYYKVSGTMSLYLDGLLVGTLANAVKNGEGDADNVDISVGRYMPSTSDSHYRTLYGKFGGEVYNPQVWLGTSVGTIPEPSTAVLSIAAGLVGLLCYAWRKRR